MKTNAYSLATLIAPLYQEDEGKMNTEEHKQKQNRFMMSLILISSFVCEMRNPTKSLFSCSQWMQNFYEWTGMRVRVHERTCMKESDPGWDKYVHDRELFCQDQHPQMRITSLLHTHMHVFILLWFFLTPEMNIFVHLNFSFYQ